MLLTMYQLLIWQTNLAIDMYSNSLKTLLLTVILAIISSVAQFLGIFFQFLALVLEIDWSPSYTCGCLSTCLFLVLQVVPILRAGLALAEHAASVLPATNTYHLGMLDYKERQNCWSLVYSSSMLGLLVTLLGSCSDLYEGMTISCVWLFGCFCGCIFTSFMSLKDNSGFF